jgi:hypothetical protein
MTRLALRRIAVVVGAVAVLGTACGTRAPGSGGGPTTGGGGPTTGPTTPVPSGISHPSGSNDLILRIEDVGGFVAPQALLQRLPTFSLYGDGTLITTGAQTEIYPQPALPPLLVQHLNEDAVQRILQLAKDAGLLGKDATYSVFGVADAPTTVFTVDADGGRHVVQAYALGFDGGHLPPGHAEARKALVKFEHQMTDLDTTLPAGSFDQPRPWDPTGLRLFVTKGDPSTAGPTQQPIAWPLDQPLDTFGDPFGTKGQPGSDTRCGTVQGADLETLLPAVQHATQISPWTDAGSTYGIAFRPLLPEESGCPPI